VGEGAFGAAGFVYCGSILAPAGDAQFARDGALCAAAIRLAEAVVDAFGLVGVNGVDFVARDGVPFPIEVNPRYSASMELAERAFGFGVFAAHARACGGDALDPALPAVDLATWRCGAPALGTAVVYARRDVTVGDTGGWLDDATLADVPHPGEHIGAGRPICTVFAEGRDAASCHAALVRRAGRVYDAVEGGR
jgi:predicted ATP-grasp superfamily ATP-dependent carboligase